jgi:protoporphyrinogen IX oxidase
MAELNWILLYLHLLANLVWIGSIVAVVVTLAGNSPPPRERGALARNLLRRVAEPAFGISFLAGSCRLLLNYEYYFLRTRFMHVKLVFALLVIALHQVIAARAKQLERGERSDAGNVGALGLGLLGGVAVVVFFVLRKPF